MTTATTEPIQTARALSPTRLETVADLINHLGGVSPRRIRMRPPPGTATEQDLLDRDAAADRLLELVDGTLVEKAVGSRESLLAVAIASALRAFVRPQRLGVVLGADGMLRLFRGLVRLPDVCFISWARMPGGRVPEQAVWDVFPDLAVEVLSEGNTPGEMARKRREYFDAGCRWVWMVDPNARTVAVYRDADRFVVLNESESLDGGEVLPGFLLGLRELFAELDEQGGVIH